MENISRGGWSFPGGLSCLSGCSSGQPPTTPPLPFSCQGLHTSCDKTTKLAKIEHFFYVGGDGGTCIPEIIIEAQ